MTFISADTNLDIYSSSIEENIQNIALIS